MSEVLNKEWIKAAIDIERDEEVLQQISILLQQRAQELQEEKDRMLREGLDDYYNGRVVTTEQVLGEIDSWRKDQWI